MINSTINTTDLNTTQFSEKILQIFSNNAEAINLLHNLATKDPSIVLLLNKNPEAAECLSYLSPYDSKPLLFAFANVSSFENALGKTAAKFGLEFQPLADATPDKPKCAADIHKQQFK